MIKLYYAQGACSLAPHIALAEVGEKYQAIKADIRAQKTENGDDFLQINPKGQVPTFVTEEGKTLTECAVILQYIADKHPEKNLLPKVGTWERYKAIEWLNYIATEIHKGKGILFAVDRLIADPTGAEQFRTNTKEGLAKKFEYLSQNLKNRNFLMGDQFTVADAYLFTILNWHAWLKVDLSKFPVLMGYMEKVKSRPGVQAALKAEGLI